MSDVLDQRVIDELCESVGGDQAFVAELIDELLDDAPRQLEMLRSAATGRNAEGARRSAHTLKGNARTFGASTLAELCLEAETAAASDELDDVIAQLDAIDAAWEQVRSALVGARDGTG